MKKFGILFTLFLSANLFAKEVSWELLKTLEVDVKTKKNKMSKDLEASIKKEISLKGFMMPLEYDAKEISEFLLMPYVPACMHIPPPPANQLILVKMKKGTKIKPSFMPVEVKGILKIEENKELESSYLMEGISMKEITEAPKENKDIKNQPAHP